MNKTIIFNIKNKALVHIFNKEKIYRDEIKKILIASDLLKKNQEIHINNEFVEYIYITHDIILKIKPINKITKKITNPKKTKTSKIKLISISPIILLLIMPMIIILFVESETAKFVSAWFLSLIGFIFFGFSLIYYENTTQIENTNKKLKKINKSKTLFLANISHELKTPISNIIGISQILLSKNLDNDSTLNIKNIYSQGNSLISLVNDILFFSQSSENLILLKTTFRLEDLISNLLLLIQVKLNVKNITLNIDDIDLIYFIIGDLDKITRILVNLISNAIKFSNNDSSIDLKINYKILKKNKIKVMFEIIDHGIGLNPKKIQKIFFPYQQEDSSTTRKYGGTGLGLAICNQLVNSMNGDIIVSSTRDPNITSFKFYLLLDYSEIKEETKKEEIKKEDTNENIIVIIDDDYESKLHNIPKVSICMMNDENDDIGDLIDILLDDFANINITKNINDSNIVIVDINNIRERNKQIQNFKNDNKKILLITEDSDVNYINIDELLIKPFSSDIFYKKIYNLLL